MKNLYVEADWGSSGLWTDNDDEQGVCMVEYEKVNLPKELSDRFTFWHDWFDMRPPEMESTDKDFDRILWENYGYALAVDLKRFVGDKYHVYYGYPYPKRPKVEEIILTDRPYGDKTFLTAKIKR